MWLNVRFVKMIVNRLVDYLRLMLGSVYEFVIVRMTADPKPDKIVIVTNSKRAP